MQGRSAIAEPAYNQIAHKHCRGVVKRHPIRDSLGRTQEVRILAEPGNNHLTRIGVAVMTIPLSKGPGTRVRNVKTNVPPRVRVYVLTVVAPWYFGRVPPPPLVAEVNPCSCIFLGGFPGY